MIVNDSVFSGGVLTLDEHVKSVLPAGPSVRHETHTGFLRHVTSKLALANAPRVAKNTE